MNAGGGWRGGVAAAVVVLVAVAVTGAVDRNICNLSRGVCRMVSSTGAYVVRNISCYCHEGGDASDSLEQLARTQTISCMMPHRPVNVSVIHLVGCKVTNQVFPSVLLNISRNSQSFELYVERSSRLRLQSFRNPPSTPQITATFLHSNLSGVPEGLVSGGQHVTMRLEGCTVDVLEPRAFVSFPEGAKVSLSLRNTSILTLQRGSFWLPWLSEVEVVGGSVMRWDRLGYTGGSKLSLQGVRLGILFEEAINLYGIKNLTMTNCVVASIYQNALSWWRPTEPRRMVEEEKENGESEATFVDNKFMQGNGKAVNLCSFANLTWRNNIVYNMTDLPFTLQRDHCQTERDWEHVFSFTGMKCGACEDFQQPDLQTCAMYQSGYCITCEDGRDDCRHPILPYVLSQCRVSHPSISHNLRETCKSDTGAKKKTAKALEGGQGALLPTLQLFLLAAIMTFIQ